MSAWGGLLAVAFLGVEHVRVEFAVLKQCRMVSRPHDAPPVQNDDVLGMTDRGEPMRHQKNGHPAIEPGQGVEHRLLGNGIHRGRRLVQNKQAGTFTKRPRHGHALPLPDGKLPSALETTPEHGIETIGKLVGQIPEPDRLQTPENDVRPPATGEAFPHAEGHVVAQRALEPGEILEERREAGVQVIAAVFPDVDPVDQDPSARRLVEAQQ